MMNHQHQDPDEPLVSPSTLRALFASSLSTLYRHEVPLYTSLLTLVSSINTQTLSRDPLLRQHLTATNSLSRLDLERHGAIRLGSANELVELTAFLRVLGMQPVGYYDLSQRPACLPIHATCFRAVGVEELAESPFRLFVSLLRPELVASTTTSEDPVVQDLVRSAIRERGKLFPVEVDELVAEASLHGNRLPRRKAERLTDLAIPSFAFHGKTTLTSDEFSLLAQSSPLLADIIAFPNPHINHLTPRTLDIDAVQHALLADPKFQAKPSGIEGPPPSVCPILLRQTSFCAVEETVYFSDGKTGRHAARFGEIEQRGAAVTQAGRELYDRMLASSNSHAELLEVAGMGDWETMRAADLIWVRYQPVPGVPKPIPNLNTTTTPESLPTTDKMIEQLLREEKVSFSPQIYEDFLPLSAAGIFQSNLGLSSDRDGISATPSSSSSSSSTSAPSKDQDTGRKQLLDILARAGAVLRDEMEVYRSIQEESKKECMKYFYIETRD